MLNVIPFDSEVDKFVDANAMFPKFKLKGSSLDRKLIREIEHGEYISNTEYCDRFGRVLPIWCMSTGCKVALCIANLPDVLIDLVECGDNALVAIFRYCKDGNARLFDTDRCINNANDFNCDIKFNGYRFTLFSRFQHYLKEEYNLCEPNMRMEGIQVC